MDEVIVVLASRHTAYVLCMCCTAHDAMHYAVRTTLCNVLHTVLHNSLQCVVLCSSDLELFPLPQFTMQCTVQHLSSSIRPTYDLRATRTLSCCPRRWYSQRAIGLPGGGVEKCEMNSLYFLCSAFSVTRSAGEQTREQVSNAIVSK